MLQQKKQKISFGRYWLDPQSTKTLHITAGIYKNFMADQLSRI